LVTGTVCYEAFVGVPGEHGYGPVANFFLIGQTHFTMLFIGWVFFFFLYVRDMIPLTNKKSVLYNKKYHWMEIMTWLFAGINN
jgi:hypothetical protein